MTGNSGLGRENWCDSFCSWHAAFLILDGSNVCSFYDVQLNQLLISSKPDW